MPNETLPWRAPVRVDTAQTGREFTLEPDAQSRRRIAEALDLLDLPRLQAQFTLEPRGKHGVDVDGRLVAEVVQACVVSLKPVPSQIDQTVKRRYRPAYILARHEANSEVELQITEDEPPEPLEGDTLDLAAIALEELSLALDPYPRCEGVAFGEPDGQGERARDNPFVALRSLREGGDGETS